MIPFRCSATYSLYGTVSRVGNRETLNRFLSKTFVHLYKGEGLETQNKYAWRSHLVTGKRTKHLLRSLNSIHEFAATINE